MNIDLEKYDHTCYIVGGGTSLKDFDWELLNDESKFVIAINSTHMVLPNANLIYVTDPPYIQDNLITLSEHKAPVWQGVLNLDKPKKLAVVDKQWHLTGKDGLETKEGCLRHGSNSAFAATNLAAVHLNFKTIYLLGIDMRWGAAGKRNTSHWHSDTSPHKRIDGEIVYHKMREAYKTIKQPLLDMGVRVINLNSPTYTALETFPIIPIEEHFKNNP